MENSTKNISSARTVRTFTDDMKRAKIGNGTLPAETKNQISNKMTDAGSGAGDSNSIRARRTNSAEEEPERKVNPQALRKMGLRADAGASVTITTDDNSVLDIREGGVKHENATIVKNVRADKWSLTREIGNSLSSWWSNMIKPTARKKSNKSIAASAESRIDVITAAGEMGHIAPRDDYKALVQNLRTFARDAEEVTGKPFTLKTKSSAGEKPRWKQIGELGAEEMGETEVVKKNALKRARPVSAWSPEQVPQHTREDVIAKSADIAVSPQEEQTLPDSAFVQKAKAVPEKRKTFLPSTLPPLPPPPPPPKDIKDAPIKEIEKETTVTDHPSQKEASEETPDSIAPSRDLKFNLPKFKKKEARILHTYRHDAIEDVEEKRLSVPNIAAAEARHRGTLQAPINGSAPVSSSRSMRIFSIAATFVSVVVVGSVLYFQFIQKDMPDSDTPHIPSFIQTSLQIPVPISLDRNTFLSALTEEISRVSGRQGSFIQLYPTLETTTTPVPSSAAVIMDVIAPRTSGSFLRTLGVNMMIGAYINETREPFIILKAEQFDTAFAGMLEWEKNMSADLAPFFGDPVRRTLNPTARDSDTQIAQFFDETIRNQDTRILYDENGEERIVYSFIDRSTIVITTTEDAFSALLLKL